MYDFEASVQLVPTFYSHPVCRLLELQLILASEEDCVQLVPKYYSKVARTAKKTYFIYHVIILYIANKASGGENKIRQVGKYKVEQGEQI